MKVSVIGTGYVGLVSGVCLAEKDHSVVCVDTDPQKIAAINEAKSPIYEKGLDELLQKHSGTNLTASLELEKAVLESDLSLIAVGTPFDGQEIDVSYIKQVATQVGRILRNKSDYHVVVVKSTVVPGTTDDVVLPILEQESGKKAGVDFGVGMNPEFLREGEAISDFMNPDRIVLGGCDSRTQDMLGELYAPFAGVDMLRTNNKTAEMIKYASNSVLATLISFSNEIANLCDVLGDIDALEVMAGVHLDKRFSPILEDGTRISPVSNTYLEAGCGFGGSCFPKDVKALISHGQKNGSPMKLLESVIEVNQAQPQQMIKLIEKHYPSLQNVNVAVLGLAFKPGTDDMRESPAITIVNELAAKGACLKAFDPVAQHEAEQVFQNIAITYCDDIESCVSEAEVVVVVTRWAEFNTLPITLGKASTAPLVVDGRRMFDKTLFKNYEGIGLNSGLK